MTVTPDRDNRAGGSQARLDDPAGRRFADQPARPCRPARGARRRASTVSSRAARSSASSLATAVTELCGARRPTGRRRRPGSACVGAPRSRAAPARRDFARRGLRAAVVEMRSTSSPRAGRRGGTLTTRRPVEVAGLSPCSPAQGPGHQPGARFLATVAKPSAVASSADSPPPDRRPRAPPPPRRTRSTQCRQCCGSRREPVPATPCRSSTPRSPTSST